jgi:hypothetical protein
VELWFHTSIILHGWCRIKRRRRQRTQEQDPAKDAALQIIRPDNTDARIQARPASSPETMQSVIFHNGDANIVY